jgi:hypothetical protein
VQVRGEQLEIPSGFHLLTRIFGAVTYVTRKEYSDREKMFRTHVELLQQSIPADAKVWQHSQLLYLQHYQHCCLVSATVYGIII